MPVYKLRSAKRGVPANGTLVANATDLLDALSLVPHAAFGIPPEQRDGEGLGWYIDVLDESDRLLLSVPALRDPASPRGADRVNH